jgi:hypothetical protein
MVAKGRTGPPLFAGSAVKKPSHHAPTIPVHPLT